MKTLLKITLILTALAATALAAAFCFYGYVTKDAFLDENKLTDYSQSITVCDSDGKEITNASVAAKRKSVKLADLNKNTINAFIASEDRTFYSHNGLNYKRMAKAVLTNLTSRSFKEGASTISQQLIKNTHLSGDKTINRKLNEIKLTRKLEKKYSKDEILEMYLNTIYFGHNCYGIESAAEFYFGTTADKLSLEQSATIVGLLTSPNNLSPFKNPEKCLAKRNIVLKCMKDCGFISQSDYETAIRSEISAEQTYQADSFSDYLSAVFDELEELGLDYYGLSEGCTIQTYLDASLQKFAENLQTDCDSAIIVTAQDGGVKAFRSSIGRKKRQPGSTIKPLLVYAPAIEEKLINPATKISDEKINFNGYSPENHDKKYHGYISVAESIAKSYNIPAVKTLNALTLKKAEQYAKKMEISLDEDEKNLSLALGGMKYGLSLEELCEKYRIFAGKGSFTQTKFIKEIKLNNGKTVYKAANEEKKVFSEGTCSLMNEILIQTAQSGTAKKLKDLPFQTAAKTGTCGTEEGNTDAYCIAYTSRDCVGVWLGDKNNEPKTITGGGACTDLVKQIFSLLYSDSPPPDLDTQTGTAEVEIDKDEYNLNNKIVLSDPASPKLSRLTVKVLKDALPKEKSTRFSCPVIQKPKISVSDNLISIVLCQTKYYSYLVNREHNDHIVTIYDGNWTEEIKDETEGGKYIYTVTPYYFDGKQKHYGKEIRLPEVSTTGSSTSPQKDMPDIVHKDWFNE